jgi:hypothetical protein
MNLRELNPTTLKFHQDVVTFRLHFQTAKLLNDKILQLFLKNPPIFYGSPVGTFYIGNPAGEATRVMKNDSF